MSTDPSSSCWGNAGTLAYRRAMMIQAFRTIGTGTGQPARLASLALGVLVGPFASTVFVSTVLWMIPRVDPRAVEVILSRIAVPSLPRFAAFAQRMLFFQDGTPQVR